MVMFCLVKFWRCESLNICIYSRIAEPPCTICVSDPWYCDIQDRHSKLFKAEGNKTTGTKTTGKKTADSGSNAFTCIPKKGARPTMPKVIGHCATYRGSSVILRDKDTWRVFVPSPLCKLAKCGRVDGTKRMLPSKAAAFTWCLDKIDEKLG